jgi:hypothetical protein
METTISFAQLHTLSLRDGNNIVIYTLHATRSYTYHAPIVFTATMTSYTRQNHDRYSTPQTCWCVCRVPSFSPSHESHEGWLVVAYTK